jgi:hypothetical protein
MNEDVRKADLIADMVLLRSKLIPYVLVKLLSFGDKSSL